MPAKTIDELFDEVAAVEPRIIPGEPKAYKRAVIRATLDAVAKCFDAPNMCQVNFTE